MATKRPWKKPLAQTLAERLTHLVHQGYWAVGAQLPPVRQLAREYEVSVNSIQGALQIMRDGGIVELRPRQGAFVRVGPRQMQSRQIAIIWPSADPDSFAEATSAWGLGAGEWTMRILRAFESVLHRAGHSLVTFPYPAEEPDSLPRLLDRLDGFGGGFAGAMFFAGPGAELIRQASDDREIPWITINRLDLREVYNFVAADNPAGGRRIGRCLASLGLQRVLLLCESFQAHMSDSEKVTGLYHGYIESGRSTCGLEVRECAGIGGDEGYRQTKDYLDCAAAAPEVIVATGDRVAVGAMRACHDHGLRIPEDVGVIGCAGYDIAAYSHPTLTTLSQPMEAMGVQAGRMLIHMVRHGVNRVVGVRVPSPIVFRESLSIPQELRLRIEQECRRDSLDYAALAERGPMSAVLAEEHDSSVDQYDQAAAAAPGPMAAPDAVG